MRSMSGTVAKGKGFRIDSIIFVRDEGTRADLDQRVVEVDTVRV